MTEVFVIGIFVFIFLCVVFVLYCKKNNKETIGEGVKDISEKLNAKKAEQERKRAERKAAEEAARKAQEEADAAAKKAQAEAIERELQKKREREAKAKELYDDFIAKNPYILYPDWDDLKKQQADIQGYTSLKDSVVEQHNKEFREAQKALYQEYFDSLLAYPLDEQQREAIVTLGENVLVTAAAGSGKTSTIVAKVHYLIEKQQVDPRDILVVTYTRKAAEELTLRVAVPGVTCSTFHKHALDTVYNITHKAPDICSPDTLKASFESLFQTDPDFEMAFMHHQTIGQNLLRYDYEYRHFDDYLTDIHRFGATSPYKDMDNKVCRLKSRQEVELFVILTELGLNIRYEERYPFPTNDSRFRQYRPDFTIHYKVQENGSEVERCLYLEHFGVDKSGRVPVWFGEGKRGGWAKANQDYRDGMEWKRQLHMEKRTDLIFTTSGDFEHGLGFVREKLKEELEKRHIPYRQLTIKEREGRLMVPLERAQENMIKLAAGFITLMKANCKTVDTIIQEASVESSYAVRNINLLKMLIKPMYEHYQGVLKTNNQIDFTDCLLIATALLNEKQIYRYQYILVDEFQDMSIDKYSYLKALRSKEPLTRLFCVGDDWQSIYRFSGSDISLFSKFRELNPHTEECKIEATHRFGEPLLQRSSEFVLHNPEQKKKKLIADKDRVTYLAFANYADDAEQRAIIEKQVAKLPEGASIYILSRYKYDICLLYPETSAQLYNEKNSIDLAISGRKVKALTVHSSKGLEADYVFLINCNSGSGAYGFPSQITDDPILGYVLSGSDKYEYAEERRLFYVAITRAKRATYVLYDKQYPSVFVTEMNGSAVSGEGTTICNRCNRGKIRFTKDGYATNGTFYTVCDCSNKYCDFHGETIFYNPHDTLISIQCWREFIAKNNLTTFEESHIRVDKRPDFEDPVLVVPCKDAPGGELLLTLDPWYNKFGLQNFFEYHLKNDNLAVRTFNRFNEKDVRLMLTVAKGFTKGDKSTNNTHTAGKPTNQVGFPVSQYTSKEKAKGNVIYREEKFK